MAEIQASLIKFYQCTTWTEGTTHGGAINTSAQITDGNQVIFDDVSDAERSAGDIEYRKIFVRNENADTVSLKCWIEDQYDASNESVAICLGTDSGVQNTAGEGDSGTYVQPTSIGHADVLNCGSLAQNASKAIWIRRTVTSGGSGYLNDSFTIKVGTY